MSLQVEIILSFANRMSAKLSSIKPLGLRKALAYRGPTFNTTYSVRIEDGVVAVQTDSRTVYNYPLNTVGRVKIVAADKIAVTK